LLRCCANLMLGYFDLRQKSNQGLSVISPSLSADWII
jgi:hypothetical protein